jgi:hypothetical protein
MAVMEEAVEGRFSNFLEQDVGLTVARLLFFLLNSA